MLNVLANQQLSGTLDYNAKDREFIFNYSQDNPISLTMPYSTKSYTSHYHLHPIFDMSMPEGYLFSLLKNLIIKEHGEINDFILFEHLSLAIESYLTYEKGEASKNKISFDLETILNEKDENLFAKLVESFLNQSAIAGVQPKVLAQLKDKATLSTKEYIVKSFSQEYPHLAENEYFCMRALNHAGIITPKFWLSASKKLFVMEKFTYIKNSDAFYGFEEFCVLFEFNKEKKYKGSYEKIAKAIYQISTQKKEDLTQFFKMMVMSYLLKNGDAHLKNFGILYTADKQKRFLAPAYDVVNTLIYLPKDKPALTLFGKKIWFSKDELVKFGTQYCMLNQKEAVEHFEVCIEAVRTIEEELKEYIKVNNKFKSFGEKFLKIIEFSLQKNLSKSYKEIPHGVL
jgi:serine/threonine-protein kinase HipA